MNPNKQTESKNKIFITGGCGFIGSHLVDLCLKKNCEVCVYDDLSYGKKGFLPLDQGQVTFIVGDILDTKHLCNVVLEFQPSVVFHLAAIHHIPTCERNPVKALNVNIEGTQNVLDASIDSGSVRRFILASSGAVYDTVDGPLNENTTKAVPNDIYSVSKLTDEYLLRLVTKKTAIQGVVARIFNCIGSRETNAHLVPEIIQQIKNGNREIRLGNLTPKRSYIHVKDTAEGLFSLFNGDIAEKFEIFNIGTDTEHSVIDIISAISEILQKDFNPVSVTAKKRIVDRPGQRADLNKIRHQLNWAPKRDLKEALSEALKDSGL